MTDYYRKNFYQDRDVAESYDTERFAHRRGIQRDAALRQSLQRALSLTDTYSILDLPCGTGRLASFFSDRGYQYFGTDIAHEMLSVLARRQLQSGRQPALARCDGEAIAFKDNSIDCVICIRLFQLEIPVEAKRQILAEMRRVSKRWLIIEHMYVPSMRSFGKLRYWLYRMLRRKNNLPALDPDVLAAGWRELDRVPLSGMKNWIGIYQKTAAPNTTAER